MRVQPLLRDDVRPREFWAWAGYDFANSSYTTVVSTAVFNAYFVSTVYASDGWNTFAWTLAISLAAALVMVAAPVAGALADARGRKKPFLAVATLLCVGGTLGLMAVGPGDVALALCLVMISAVGFGLGESLIAAWLPLLGRSEALGRLSGYAWAIGYGGGLLALGMCLAYVQGAQSRGAPAEEYVAACMFITAVFFALAALPSFIWLKEHQAGAQPLARLGARAALDDALARLQRTWRESAAFVDLKRLLLAIVSYQAGVAAVVALAAIYAQEAMGFSTRDTLLLILLVNVTAAIGALGFGRLQDRIGHRAALMLSLAAWIVMVVLAWFAVQPWLFWIAANFAGLAMGASQSAGRALVGYLSPPDRVAEFFGLWGLAVRLSTILGPISYGLVNLFTAGNHRLSMLWTGLFFVIGILLVARVDVARGHAQAHQDTA